MNVVSEALHHAAIGVAVADDPSSIQAFLEPEYAAAIWKRKIPQINQTWLNSLDSDVLPSGRIVLRPEDVSGAINKLCDASGLPVGTNRDWLVADIVSLSQMFSDLMGVTHLRLRLSVVTTNACRKFHVDAITSRLLCTYRGTGTQYGMSVSGENPTRVFTVQTGALVLLRGTLWPAQPSSGLLHRSPPIEGTGESRLVLVVDPIFDPKVAV